MNSTVYANWLLQQEFDVEKYVNNLIKNSWLGEKEFLKIDTDSGRNFVMKMMFRAQQNKIIKNIEKLDKLKINNEIDYTLFKMNRQNLTIEHDHLTLISNIIFATEKEFLMIKQLKDAENAEARKNEQKRLNYVFIHPLHKTASDEVTELNEYELETLSNIHENNMNVREAKQRIKEREYMEIENKKEAARLARLAESKRLEDEIFAKKENILEEHKSFEELAEIVSNRMSQPNKLNDDIAKLKNDKEESFNDFKDRILNTKFINFSEEFLWQIHEYLENKSYENTEHLLRYIWEDNNKS